MSEGKGAGEEMPRGSGGEKSGQTSSARADEISESREAVGSIKDDCGDSSTDHSSSAQSSSSDQQASEPSPQEVQALLLLHRARASRAPSASTPAPPPASLGNRVDLPPASLQPPSFRSPLLQQLQSTLLAQGAAEVRQAPHPPAAATPHSYASILEQLATSQAPQRPDSSSTQSTSALLDAYLRQRLSAYQPVTVQRPSPPLAPASPPSTLPASLLQQLQPMSPGQGAAAAGGLQRSPPPPYASVLEQLAATQATQRPDSALLDAYLRQQLLAGQQLTTAERSSLETLLLQNVSPTAAQLSSMAGLVQDAPLAPPSLPASLLHRLGLPAQASAASAASAYPPERLGLLAPAPAASTVPPSNLPLSSLSPHVYPQILQSLLQELPTQNRTTASSARLPQAQERASLEAMLLLHQLGSVQRKPRPPLSAEIGLLAPSGTSLPIGAAPSMSAPASQDQSQILERLIQNYATGGQQNSTTAQSAIGVESLLQRLASSSCEVPRHQDASPAVASRPESQSISSASTSSFMENIAAADLAARQQNQGVNRAKEKRWMAKYEELKLFREGHGHCRVPHGYAANRKLSWWVMNQRAQYHLYKEGKRTWLTEDRVQLLNDITFDWAIITSRSKR